MALCICIYKDRRLTKGKVSQINSCRVRSERGNSGSSNNSCAHIWVRLSGRDICQMGTDYHLAKLVE